MEQHLRAPCRALAPRNLQLTVPDRPGPPRPDHRARPAPPGHHLDGQAPRGDGRVPLGEATRFLEGAGPVERETAKRLVQLIRDRAVGDDLSTGAKRLEVPQMLALDPLERRLVVGDGVVGPAEEDELEGLEFRG